MQDLPHLRPLTQADPVAEVVHYDREVVEVVADVRGQGLLVATAHDHLPRQRRRPPKQVEGELIGFHQMALAVAAEVEEEVDVADGARAIVDQLRIARPRRPARDGSLDQLTRTRVVPLGGRLLWHSSVAPKSFDRLRRRRGDRGEYGGDEAEAQNGEDARLDSLH